VVLRKNGPERGGLCYGPWVGFASVYAAWFVVGKYFLHVRVACKEEDQLKQQMNNAASEEESNALLTDVAQKLRRI